MSAAVKESSPLLRLPLIDIPLSPDQILASARQENYLFGNNRIAGTVIHWGYQVDDRELVESLRSRGVEATEEQFQSTGFKNRSIYPAATSHGEQAEIELRVGAEVVERGCDNRGITPADLSYIFVSNTIPGDLDDQPCDDFAEQVRLRTGAVNAEVVNVSLACNGAVYSMRKIAEHEEAMQGAYGCVASVEGLTKAIGEWNQGTVGDPKRLHPTNVSIFTNGGGSVVWKIGEDFKLKPVGGFEVIADDKGVLRAPCPYTFEANDPTGLMITQSSVRQKLAEPVVAGDLLAYMDPTLTSRWAVKYVPEIFAGYIKDFISQFGDYPDVLFSHEPSRRMLTGILDKMPSFGLNIDGVRVPRVIDDGNSSSGVFLAVLLRGQEAISLKSGDHALGIGFGLGSNFSAVALSLP